MDGKQHKSQISTVINGGFGNPTTSGKTRSAGEKLTSDSGSGWPNYPENSPNTNCYNFLRNEIFV
jgi:hypothetical protein